jgi:hypothetical protein
MANEIEHMDNPTGEPGAGGVEPEEAVEGEVVPTGEVLDTGEGPTPGGSTP